MTSPPFPSTPSPRFPVLPVVQHQQTQSFGTCTPDLSSIAAFLVGKWWILSKLLLLLLLVSMRRNKNTKHKRRCVHERCVFCLGRSFRAKLMEMTGTNSTNNEIQTFHTSLRDVFLCFPMSWSTIKKSVPPNIYLSLQVELRYLTIAPHLFWFMSFHMFPHPILTDKDGLTSNDMCAIFLHHPLNRRCIFQRLKPNKKSMGWNLEAEQKIQLYSIFWKGTEKTTNHLKQMRQSFFFNPPTGLTLSELLPEKKTHTPTFQGRLYKGKRDDSKKCATRNLQFLMFFFGCSSSTYMMPYTTNPATEECPSATLRCSTSARNTGKPVVDVRSWAWCMLGKTLLQIKCLSHFVDGSIL